MEKKERKRKETQINVLMYFHKHYINWPLSYCYVVHWEWGWRHTGSYRIKGWQSGDNASYLNDTWLWSSSLTHSSLFWRLCFRPFWSVLWSCSEPLSCFITTKLSIMIHNYDLRRYVTDYILTLCNVWSNFTLL